MADLRRWIRELMHPTLKCARVGHKMRSYQRTIWLYPPTGIRAVADEAQEVTHYCGRCGGERSVDIEDRRGLTGLSMPSPHWAALRRNGRYPS